MSSDDYDATKETGAFEADAKLKAAIEDWYRESCDAIGASAVLRGWMIVAEGRGFGSDVGDGGEVQYFYLGDADSVQRLALSRYLYIKVDREFPHDH